MSRFRISPELAELGFKPVFLQKVLAWAELAGAPLAVPARVVCERRGEYEVHGEAGLGRAKLSGRLLHELTEDTRPAVGDWVMVEPGSPLGRVVALLERCSVLRRQSAGATSQGQPLAANVDLAFVVAALVPEGADRHVARRALNPRRLERYLALIHACRIEPVVVINKADVALEPEEAAAELRVALPGVAVELVSAALGDGIERLRQRIAPGDTAVLLGSSGVGKSTLVNRLVGREIQRTSEVRDADARGRHTTTERELLVLPGGGLLIDTPGMRELALYAEDSAELGSTFSEIEELAERCRYRDCTHREEPGCAVLAAIAAGTLPAERLESARKLEAELRHQRVRADARLRQEEKRRFRARTRELEVTLRRKGRT
jgi:ribosome biogenesis GTPase / thiamine phosphate phosphatase